MKKILFIGVILTSVQAYAQVIIGDATGTATNKTSVLLEFANSNNKGIILPYVTTVSASPSEGTLILDASSPTTARVKYYNGAWVDLSGQDGNVSAALASQPTLTENSSSKAIIGAQASSADGVLVLESATKAMVLPTVTDVNNIPSPSPGMLVYVKGTGTSPKKRLAVYNGSKWSFWKP